MPLFSTSEQESAALKRRDFLRLASMASIATPLSPALIGLVQNSAHGQAKDNPAPPDTAPESPELIVRQRQPDNLESPFEKLSGIYTPNERFYVRSHFAVPRLDSSTWRLRVEGAVEHPVELSYQDLLGMPADILDVTLECAGNGRSFLTPAAKGVQWGQGAVSTAKWQGVSLAAILKKAGVRRQATEVILQGADYGEPKDLPLPPGPIPFARSLPLQKALQGDVLIAYKMNGSDLPIAHGFPARAVVPGWYGVASVKWLTHILVTDRAFQGYFQTTNYAIWERSTGIPARTPITELQVKAQIAQPQAAQKIKAGTTYRIYGAAWAGEPSISRVEISTNGGTSWQLATLLGNPARYTWRLWEYPWTVPGQPGTYTLLARATDSRGNVQDLLRQSDRENYMINHVFSVPVDVY